jgi:hypothetical protein
VQLQAQAEAVFSIVFSIVDSPSFESVDSRSVKRV